MSDISWQKIETILDKALELPEEQRKEFIETTCQGKPKLKSEVTQLLESIFDSEGWLENAGDYKRDIYDEMADDVKLLSSQKSLIGTNVGSYLIEKKVGEGGMGSVYLAKHSNDNIKHAVAIKIIRSGKATSENIKRFKREQQILAGLHHPGIARMYDAGTTEDGYPYIIMEYVDGTAITEYCNHEHCSLDEKLKLFTEVLEAVRHAHENLVIHRDLKPGNILVDQSGNIKVLDFGISKLLEDDEDPSLTKTGARLLTPRYAAPEQIRQENITTATDLYALGIIFYQLLAGVHPFPSDDLSRYDMEQAILKQEAARPSSRVSDPTRSKQIQGDLDDIALKAIRKEKEERYRVANEFIEDLNNHKNGLPVSAAEDSFQYRGRKFFNRHKQGVAVATAILLLIFGLTGFFTWQIAQERNEAEIEAEKARTVKALLVDIFKANDPISGDAETATLPQLLENGTKEILERDLDLEVKNELLFTLGTIYQNIADFEKAEELAQKTLELNRSNFGENSVQAAKSYIQLAGIDYNLGEYEDGKKELEKAEGILNSQQNKPSPEYTELYHHLGLIAEETSNYDSSQVYFEKALTNIQQQAHVDTAMYIDVVKNLARNVHRKGHYKKADSLMFVALKTSERFNGEHDVVTASIAGDIGLYYMTRAKYDSARRYYRQSLDIKEKLYEDNPHPNYSATLTNLAVLEAYVGNNAVAESLFTKTLEIDTELFGDDHPYVGYSKGHLSGIYLQKGQLDKARKLRDEQFEIYQNNYDSGHYNFAAFYKHYANILSLQQEFEKAEAFFLKSEKIYSNFLDSDHDDFAKLYEAWAQHYYRTDQYGLAAKKFEEAARIFMPSQYDEYKIRAAKCMINAGKSYAQINEKQKSEQLFQQVKAQIDTVEALSDNEEVAAMYDEALAQYADRP